MIHGQVSDLGEIPGRIEAAAGIECETKDALIRSVSKGMPRAAIPTGYVVRGDPADIELILWTEDDVVRHYPKRRGWR
jgi:hypothetical protein